METIAGLQVWDRNGKLVLSLTDRITRVIGYRDILNTDIGSMHVEEFSEGTPWLYVIRITGDAVINREYYNPDVTIVGNVIKFTRTSLDSFKNINTFRIIYGVY